MNPTVEILKSIGIRPDICNPPRRQQIESEQLYDIARRNKIGSLYVKKLHETGELSDLSEMFANRRNYQCGFKRTIRNICVAIPENFRFALVKSSYPFWVDASDVDVLVFEDDIQQLVPILRDRNYNIYDTSPTAISATDRATGLDVDVQIGFSLQEVIYFDRDSMYDQIDGDGVSHKKAPTVSKPADLALIIIHSLSEQMFLLKEFYGTIAILDQFSSDDLRTFNKIVSENNIGYPTGVFLSLVDALLREVFEYRIDALTSLLDEYGYNEQEPRLLRETNYEMPHTYSTRSLFLTCVNKLRNELFRRSLLRQLPRFLNPSYTYKISRVIYARQKRTHYVHDTTDIEGENK